MPHDPLHVVIGAGPSGLGLIERLRADGRRVRVVTRSGKANVPDGVDVVACDIKEPESAKAACSSATVVFSCVGLPSYQGWREKWPKMMAGMLAGAAAAGARFVFTDNLYMYGPVDGPLREDLPLTSYGKKPSVRSQITRMWKDAHDAGKLRVAAVRPSDFYGPRVRNAVLGDYVVKPAVRGGVANLVGDPDVPHTFTYMSDIVRALVDIGDAGDEVYGQAWHVPSAPAIPVREVVEMVYRAAGHPPKIRTASRFMLSILGLFDVNMREMKEMLYQWTKPYVVVHEKFAAKFWDDYTPLEVGVDETVAWFRSALARS